jgi:hypothetical protein
MAKKNAQFEDDTICEALPSSCLSQACYDDVKGTLDVTFRESGRTYRYYGIEERKAQYLMEQAPSPGRFYNRHIKGQFARRKLAR